ncbi:hypothetical protein Nepgr_006264 [Nepenthes gracilis]|uniref:C3H1-type domain-containing protein n=1 Tax=Nepenthes gracilis TaxID=150966 RepID=A0AAD3XH88_NEPGR|nr:hypothetical protein Nepgr_006264 [Nepenthes gracilis]
MTHLTAETENSSSLLELAANNDVEGFKWLLECGAYTINEVGLWYGRQKGSRQMVREHRTPLMVAATYGSVDVLKLMLTQGGAEVNLCCVPDKCTALHCAASGGSVDAVEVVKLLLESGADPNAMDVNGLRPFDVIVVPPKLTSMRASMEELLMGNDSCNLQPKLRISITSSIYSSLPLYSSSESGSPSSPTDSVSSPMILKSSDLPTNPCSEKKEYPVDPSLPDIKDSIYATDEFRMFSFKIRPCSRAYSHDWTECPFVHPGENARRRDPRKFHYSCVPCPDFRKGACRRGDMCEYAHGVFECWLHPAQYRTRLCKDGTNCNRRVCFFAHRPEELRPLYHSTGSAVPSPSAVAPSVTVMDMAAALNLFPGSPSCPSPFPQHPISPPMNGIVHSNGAWPQPNVPTLHLPGNNLQSSRLRSSLSARDIPPEDLSMLSNFDLQQHALNDLTSFSKQRSNPPSCLSYSGRAKSLAPSNLDELFSAELTSSPRYSDQAAAVFSLTQKSAALNQFQQQQSRLSPINTNVFSPRSVEHPLLQASLCMSSPGRMSPRSAEPISPMSSRLSSFVMREKQSNLRCLSARDLGSKHLTSIAGSPVSSWSHWGSPNGKADWSANVGDELGLLRRSSSFELMNNGEEPDLSWVQSLVKESPPEMKEKTAALASAATPIRECLTTNPLLESVDHSSVLGAWLEEMQLDQP